MISKERRIFVFAMILTVAISAGAFQIIFSDQPLVIGPASVVSQDETALIFYGSEYSKSDALIMLNVVGVAAGIGYVMSLALIGKR